MTNRREFLQTGVAVSALPLAINALLAPEAAAMSPAHIPTDSRDAVVHRAVYDNRYAEGLVFSQRVAQFGVPAHALKRGDVTERYEELDLVWRNERLATAGLTQFGPMLVLERLANERGMRTFIRVEHRARADGMLSHVIQGPAESAALAERLSVAGMGWPSIMAALVTHCRADIKAPVERIVITPGPPPVLTSHEVIPASVIHYYTTLAVAEGRPVPLDGPLFSWLVAPVVGGQPNS